MHVRHSCDEIQVVPELRCESVNWVSIAGSATSPGGDRKSGCLMFPRWLRSFYPSATCTVKATLAN